MLPPLGVVVLMRRLLVRGLNASEVSSAGELS
jgi:ABC-type glycerol-3-phosphate transport system permease component